MEKPLISIRPNLLNALLPEIMRNILIAVFLSIGFVSIAYIAGYAKTTPYMSTFWQFFVPAVTIINLRAIWQAAILWNTKYIFFQNHLVKEFELFKEKRISVLYEYIVNVKTDLSFWDRICNSGNIEILLKDSKPAIVTLKYVKNPKKIESFLMPRK